MKSFRIFSGARRRHTIWRIPSAAKRQNCGWLRFHSAPGAVMYARPPVPVPIRTSRRTRSGRSMAKASTARPPIEWPTASTGPEIPQTASVESQTTTASITETPRTMYALTAYMVRRTVYGVKPIDTPEIETKWWTTR